MLATAAARLGLRSHIYAPEADSPAFDVAAFHTVAEYADETALAAFAKSVAVITYEFENVPAATAALLTRLCPVYPDARALETAQDRLTEKSFLRNLGVATAPFAAVDTLTDLITALAAIGRPAVLKTRRMGYDGKGQAMIRQGDDTEAAFRALGGKDLILEGFVQFEREVSVIAARGQGGEFRAYDICENIHKNHILAQTLVPAHLDAAACKRAENLARQICEALGYVGVTGVEMFAAADGVLIVNEIAPRVHNSGHWTIDGAVTSQFEQHIRAICGWPLGSTRRHGAIDMRNLIGTDALDWRKLAAQDGVALHLYGKGEARAGRKMGHFTRVMPET